MKLVIQLLEQQIIDNRVDIYRLKLYQKKTGVSYQKAIDELIGFNLSINIAINSVKSNNKFDRWTTSEKPPNNNRQVLVFTKVIGVITGHYWGAGHKNEPSPPCNGWSIMGVTHWMESPKNPKMKDGKII
jgi:hypothetical protein